MMVQGSLGVSYIVLVRLGRKEGGNGRGIASLFFPGRVSLPVDFRVFAFWDRVNDGSKGVSHNGMGGKDKSSIGSCSSTAHTHTDTHSLKIIISHPCAIAMLYYRGFVTRQVTHSQRTHRVDASLYRLVEDE